MFKQGRDARATNSVEKKHKTDGLGRLFCAFFDTPKTLVKTSVSTSVCKRAALAVACLLISTGVLLGALTDPRSAHAAATTTLNFQGRLLSSTGSLVADGIYNMQFDLYYAAGGTLWTEDRLVTNTQGVTVINGYFSVRLAEYDAFPSTINWDQELYLGLTIRGTSSCAWGACSPADAEMTPRTKLTAVPYSFKAAVALNVASNNETAASTNSANVSIVSGNAGGVTSNSGNITIDVGTATQTAGTISVGTANTTAISIGRTGITTTNNGALTVTQLTTANGGISIGTQALTGTTGIIDYTDFDVSADGLITLAPDGGGTGITLTPSAALTTGLDVSNANITNGVSLGATTLLGTTAVINFTNFDVSSAGAVTAVGVNAGAGLLQGQLGLTVTGNTSLSTAAGNTVVLGNSTGTFQLDSTGLDVSTAGALSGITTLTGGTTLTLVSTGAGNDIIINGADILDVQDNATFAGTLQVSGIATLGTVSSVAGSLQIYDANGQKATITLSDIAADRALSIPVATGSDTFCLLTLGNCFGSGTGGTLQASYNADVDGSDSTISLTSADDSIIFSNPSSSGTDSGFVLKVEQLNTGIATDALTVSSSGTGDILEFQDNGTAVLRVTDGGHIIANASTGATGTTTGTETNTTTLTLTTDPYSVNDIVFIDNVGQDYYTRITVDPGTGSYTVSPAVTFETGRTTTKYLAQNIGATATDYTTQTNRFFQGYFTGGVVTGAGSTTLSDGRLTSTTLLNIDGYGTSVKGAATSVITGSIDPTASASVTGVGTLFLSQLQLGDRITVNAETRTVTAIASNTSLTVDTAFTDTANDTTIDRLAAALVVRDSSSVVKLVVNDLGYVGIGTAAPISNLDVTSASTTGITLSTSAASTNVSLKFLENNYTSGITLLYDATNNELRIQDSGTTDRFTFERTGNLGIGTTTPGYNLDVTGTVRTTGQIIASDSNSCGGGNTVQVAFDGTDTDTGFCWVSDGSMRWIVNAVDTLSVTSTAVYVGGTAGRNLNVNGQINANGGHLVFNSVSNGVYFDKTNDACLSGGGTDDGYTRLSTGACGLTYTDLAVDNFWAAGALRYDIAEFTPVKESDNLIPGDIVSSDPDQDTQLRRARTAYDPTVFGIVSSVHSASMVIGGKGPEAYATDKSALPIAIGGRVLVKVSTENGNISRGDPITTSSIRGTGMKITKTGPIVGKSMDIFDPSQMTCIPTPTAEGAPWLPFEDPALNPNGIPENECFVLPDGTYLTRIRVFVSPSWYVPEVEVLTSLNVSGPTTLSDLTVTGDAQFDGNLSVGGDADLTGSLTVTGAVQLESTLTVVGNTELQGDLKVLGNTEVANITVNGKIITAGATPTVVLGAYTIVGENSTVTVAGNDTAGMLTYTAGVVNLPAYDLASGGQTNITFAAPFTSPPRIALTPKDTASAAARYYVTTTETGFTINFLDPPVAGSTYTFDYILLQ